MLNMYDIKAISFINSEIKNNTGRVRGGAIHYI